MIIHKVVSAPFKTNEGTFRQTLTCHRIINDADAKEYLDALNEGVQILQAVGEYVIIKKISKLPFDLHGGSNKNLANK